MKAEAAFHPEERTWSISDAEVVNRLVQDAAGAEQILSEIGPADLPEERKRALRDYALVVQRQEQRKDEERDVTRDGYSLHLLPGAAEEIPDDFIEGAYAFALQHGKKLKHADRSEKGELGINEIVWKFPGKKPGQSFVIKLIQPNKMPTEDHELRILQRATMLELPAPRPLGLMRIGREDAFIMMEYVDGESGMDIWEKLKKQGWAPDEIASAKNDVDTHMRKLAELFRAKMCIDKPWYIKDCLLRFNGKRVEGVFPLDWERAHPYNPRAPDRIRSTPPTRPDEALKEKK